MERPADGEGVEREGETIAVGDGRLTEEGIAVGDGRLTEEGIAVGDGDGGDTEGEGDMAVPLSGVVAVGMRGAPVTFGDGVVVGVRGAVALGEGDGVLALAGVGTLVGVLV